jgi:hypothetical protein
MVYALQQLNVMDRSTVLWWEKTAFTAINVERHYDSAYTDDTDIPDEA